MATMITRLARKAWSPIKEFGFCAGVLYGLDQTLIRLGSRFRIYYYELMEQPVPDKPIAPPNLIKSFEVREILEGDELITMMPPPPNVIAHRFQQNVVCLGAFSRSNFIGYLWLCFGPYEEDEVRCTYIPLPHDEAVFDFDLYLFPKHRLGLGFAALWDGANRYMRGRGIRSTFSRVSRFNTAAKKSHSHLGCQCIGKAVFLRGKHVQIMFSTKSPHIHLSFGEQSRPQLHMRRPEK